MSPVHPGQEQCILTIFYILTPYEFKGPDWTNRYGVDKPLQKVYPILTSQVGVSTQMYDRPAYPVDYTNYLYHTSFVDTPTGDVTIG